VTASNLFCCNSPKALRYQIIGVDRQTIEGVHVALNCAILVHDSGVGPGDESARGCLGLRKAVIVRLSIVHSLTTVTARPRNRRGKLGLSDDNAIML